MIYNEFSDLGFKVSQLGFGVMRLPDKEKNGKACVDWEKSIPLLRKGAELGINFYDTHPMYCHNESEQVLGEALSGIDQKIYVQTKCPLWKDLEPGESWRMFLDQSLEHLQRNYIDIYIAHALKWETFREKGDDFLKMVTKAMDEGIVGTTGFSSHDTPENVMKLLDVDEFKCMTIQYNLLDRQYEECIEKAAKKGMAVIIMGPVSGGIFEEYPKGMEQAAPESVDTAAELALKFVLRNSNVTSALSGMSSIPQVEENVKKLSGKIELPDEKLNDVYKQVKALKEECETYCTGCNYCMPCPQGIMIPQVFKALSILKVYGSWARAKELYDIFTSTTKEGKERKPSVCIECGECMEKCPQDIDIINQLKEVERIFEGGE